MIDIHEKELITNRNIEFPNGKYWKMIIFLTNVKTN